MFGVRFVIPQLKAILTYLLTYNNPARLFVLEFLRFTYFCF